MSADVELAQNTIDFITAAGEEDAAHRLAGPVTRESCRLISEAVAKREGIEAKRSRLIYQRLALSGKRDDT